ncbi:mitochondrial import inner membrane translocase subunit Tim23 [Thrips palmi]|uniref:Mitochondrial import inner membrane translocase subunit Tim23 n=1 Tax=Thrips palmi TaxID=161013 RepID=A0A6P8ZAN7_THRPL|nr:mitochondrial import inner membrane translocase subunit Tim23 [Thrips palmi]
MDDDGSKSYSNSDVNIPVNVQGNLRHLSPYLNFDPVYLPPTQPEFIFPEGAARQRGRFEHAFSQIGASCMVGAGVGGMGGLYNGLRLTTLAGQKGRLRVTQLINHTMKKGAASANTLGIIALMYSGFGVVLSYFRNAEDELNTLAAATLTGMVYKSTSGLRKCATGGAVGLGIAAAYCLWTSRDRHLEFKRQLHPI